jgi:hypothetical protein
MDYLDWISRYGIEYSSALEDYIDESSALLYTLANILKRSLWKIRQSVSLD